MTTFQAIPDHCAMYSATLETLKAWGKTPLSDGITIIYYAAHLFNLSPSKDHRAIDRIIKNSIINN